MTPKTEKEVFYDALEIESDEDRRAFVNDACADNEELRSAVTALLQQHEKHSPIDSPIVSVAKKPTKKRSRWAESSLAGPSYAPGSMIGPYKLMEQIGEGGFGVVFVADQREPVQRRVALKLIKPGMESREVIARFEAERQAIAMMDHPNIARVFEAGVTDTSQPYFVMELVRGVPLNKFCDNHKLSTRDRLELFVSVCHALQHAHQKGIIHRDLKPSNVLVTLQDGKPIAKVIDFGVAKAIGQSLTGKTIYTRFASMIGTPAYMSPEQAEMSNVDIDTRSDIYSLGVLLYELLTGSTPFAGDRLESVGFDELRRIIREEEPPRPSARLSTLNADIASTISTNRQLEPSRLTSSVKGDLDWIVMKAIDKDRNRRYANAGALADDISRFLTEQPVAACPPSTWYRLSKFYKRNRVAITTACVVFGALLLGTAISVWQARVATLALSDVKKAKNEAEAARSELSEFSDRLKEANILLSTGRAHLEAGRLPEAYESYTRATETQPKYFHVWVERGSLHKNLGLWNEAADDYTKALNIGWTINGPESMGVPQLFYYTGQFDAYLSICKQLDSLNEDPFGAALRGRLVGEVSPEVAGHLAEEAEARVSADNYRPSRGGRGSDRGRGRGSFEEHSHHGPERTHDRGEFRSRRGGPSRREGKPFGADLYALGWAKLHTGEYEVAIESLLEAGRAPWPGRGIELPLLAIAYHRTDRSDDALAACEHSDRELDRWLETALASPDNGPGMPWFDWIEFLINHKQASILVRGQNPSLDPRFNELRNRSLSSIR